MDRELSNRTKDHCQTDCNKVHNDIDVQILFSSALFDPQRNQSIGTSKKYRCKMLLERVCNNHQRVNLRYRAHISQFPLQDLSSQKIHELIQKLKNPAVTNIGSCGDKCNPISIRITAAAQEVDPWCVPALSHADIISASDAKLLDWTLGSKEQSIRVQNAIEEENSETHARLIEFSKNHFGSLIESKLGGFVLSKLAKKNQAFLNHLTGLCLPRVFIFSQNEYSSSVVRRLMQLSPSFCSAVMSVIKYNLRSFVQSPAGRYIVMCGISSVVEEVDRDVIGNFLEKNNNLWSESRHLKIVVSTYIKRCSQDRLDVIFYRMNLPERFLCYLNDKDASDILYQLICRRHIKTMQLFAKHLDLLFYKTIGAAYFSHLLGQLLLNSDTSCFVSQIYSYLRSVDEHILKTLQTEQIRVYLMYCSAVSICSLALTR
jgi:hypothetical protein